MTQAEVPCTDPCDKMTHSCYISSTLSTSTLVVHTMQYSKTAAVQGLKREASAFMDMLRHLINYHFVVIIIILK